MNSKRLLHIGFFTLICFIMQPAWAQNRTITGKVTDSKDKSGLVGVSVVATGSSTGAATDADGNFRITVPTNATSLTITYISYDRKVVPISGSVMDITLNATNTALNEVLVVGYGTVRKKDATGAVQKVSSGDFVQGVTTNPLQQLQGKAAGVTITTTSGDPNANPTVRIRGTASLSGGNDPLYVIDGVQGADIRSVSPSDIESFDVLKDASAAAIYGSRAAGGVIIVTTKTGKAGKTQVSVNSYGAVESPQRLPNFMNRDQYVSAYQSFTGNPISVFDPAKPSTTSDQGANTNWFKEITRTAVSHNENLSIAGGTEKSHYRGSVTYYDQQGIVKTNYRKDINARFNFDQKALNDKLLITMNVSGSHTNLSSVDGNILLNAAAVPSIISPYNPLNPNNAVVDKTNPLNLQLINNTQEANPLGNLLYVTNVNSTDRLVGNIRLDYTLAKDLTISPYANATRNNGVNNIFYPPSQLVSPIADFLSYTPASISNNGDVDKGSNTATTQTYGVTANYRGVFGKHRLNVLGGVEQFENNFSGMRVGAHDLGGINLPNQNINAANFITNKDIASYYNGFVLKSIIGRVEYNYNDKYYITANARYDQSNKLGLNDQSKLFPSGSIAWNINNEDFLKDVSWISSLKLRAGYGQTGNQDAIGPYLSQFLFGPTGRTYYDYLTNSFLTSNFAVQNQNQNLKWEVNTTVNIATDFSLFQGRLNGSVDFYNRKTTNLLFTYAVPTGGQYFVNTIIANIGSLQNRGFEINLNGKAINTQSFTWNPGINFGLNRNKILNLSGNFNNTVFNVTQAQIGNTGGTGISGAISNIGYLKVGFPVGTLLLPEYAGQDAKGNQLFYKYNADGSRTTVTDPTTLNLADDGSTQDRKFYSTQEKFTYAITNAFTYKQFDLNIFMRGSYGGKAFNEVYMDYTSLQKLGTYAVLADATKYNITSSSQPSTYWLQSTSFLKIQSATLGYNVVIKENNYISNVHLYFAGNNIYTITKYKGLDPEIVSSGIFAGIDQRTALYPRPRQFSLGVNLTLK